MTNAHDFEDYDIGAGLTIEGTEAGFEFLYPGVTPNKLTHITVDLMHVRAADGIRISYDFDRDGWKIEQASRFAWNIGEECDPKWKEVAFIQAWASQDDPEELRL